MITYSVNGNIVKHNNLSAKSNKIIEAMTEQETELNMAGSLNISGTVKAAKFMTADGTIIDIADTNSKLKELRDNRVTPQEYKDLRDEMLKADQGFANKSEMSNLVDQISALKAADQGFATKDNLVEVSTTLQGAIQSVATATQSVATNAAANTNNDLHNKERAGNVTDTIPANYNPTMELKHFHSTNKDSTIGYGGSSIQFSTNNGANGGGSHWPTGSIVSNIDPNNSTGYQGGLLFYTAAGGLNKPQKLTMSMGGPDQRTYFAGNVGIGTKDPKEKLEVNGTINVNGNLKVNNKVIHVEEDDNSKIVPNSYWMSYYTSNNGGNALNFIKDELKTDWDINYNWGSGKVGSSNINDNVFIKFSGHITSNVSGNTLFRVKTDDGARLFFNNKQTIYSWKLQGPTYHQSGFVNLKENIRYPFVLEWYEHGGGATIILEWKKPGGNWEVIPADAFSTNLKPGGILPLASGISHYEGQYGKAEYYKIGNIVYVDGLIKGTDGKSHLATLPFGYRPDKRLIFNLNNHSGTYRLDVTVDGVIYWITGSRTHNWLSLTGISFYVKG